MTCESGGLDSVRPDEARRTCNENSCHLMNLLRSQCALECSCDELGTMSASLVRQMLDAAGLVDIEFREDEPCWCVSAC